MALVRLMQSRLKCQLISAMIMLTIAGAAFIAMAPRCEPGNHRNFTLGGMLLAGCK